MCLRPPSLLLRSDCSGSCVCFGAALQFEGVVVKALDSAWVINGRNSSWIKLKPDYVHATEIDALIIGIYKPTHGKGEFPSLQGVVLYM